MRIMAKNSRLVEISHYIGLEEMQDEEGYLSGESKVAYTEPVQVRANVSAAVGDTDSQQFGNFTAYDKVLIFADSNLPITEHSILWIDESDTAKPHDYVVCRIAKSLNTLAVSVKKVVVS